MYAPLKTLWSPETLPYLGPELRPHFIYEKFNLRGSALVSFQGPCHVQTEHLVDWEDRLAQDHIQAAQMLHILGEFFGLSITAAVAFQRLWVACALEVLRELGIPDLTRTGDDLWIGKRKLSVSIVTVSPVSALLHLGLNIDPEGAPVPAAGLGAYGLTAEQVAPLLLERFAAEWAGVQDASVKVRAV